MNNNWVRVNNDFFLQEVSQQMKKIPVGVFKINQNPMTSELYLTFLQDKFEFPYKIYGVENAFVDRVEKTFKNTTGNLGILMNGVKGTGKTVTSEMICNKLGLPVLIVPQQYKNLPSFINEIQQDVIVFFDEYEKMYNNYDASILTVMDGVLNNEHKKVFLLTTNNSYINDNLLQRPGRIRYIKEFTDLTLETIMEIVDDKLIHKHLREKCIDFISKLETITMDIVNSVLQEVNIHNEDPVLFKDYFNINMIDNRVNLYVSDAGSTALTKLAHKDVAISPAKITQSVVGQWFRIADQEFGKISKVIDDKTIVVNKWDDEQEDFVDSEIFRIETLVSRHQSFSSKFLV